METLEKAESELAWFLTKRPGALGYGAQNYESNGGPAVWDDLRIHTAHMAKRTPQHRDNLKRESRIRPLFFALPEEDQMRAIAAFDPCGSSASVISFFAHRGFEAPLVGLSLLTGAFAEVREKQRIDSVNAAMLQFDGLLKSEKDGAPKSPPRWLREAKSQGVQLFTGVLGRYEVMRLARVNASKDERAEQRGRRTAEIRERARAQHEEHRARLRGAL